MHDQVIIFYNIHSIFFVKIATQLSSHNCPIESSDSLDNPGNTKAFVPLWESFNPNGRFPEWVAFMVASFGNITLGPSSNGATFLAHVYENPSDSGWMHQNQLSVLYLSYFLLYWRLQGRREILNKFFSK